MADPFKGAFTTGSSGSSKQVTRAIKMADIYVKTHTGADGKVTDPNVYNIAVNTYLSPYSTNLSAQQKIAEYANTAAGLNGKQESADNTVQSFKEAVMEAITLKTNAELADTGGSIQKISARLDVTKNAIDSYIADAKTASRSVPQSVLDYAKVVNNMANAQRSLVSNYLNGTNDKALNAYGVYIQTNPADNSVLSGTIMPSNYVPDEFKQNTKRIETAQQLGQNENPSFIPVYLPAYDDGNGNYTAKLGNNVWSGTGSSGSLSGDSSNTIQDKFDISNDVAYPTSAAKPLNLQKGQFGYSIVDAKGNKNYYWKGQDDSIRVLDSSALTRIANDPLLMQEVSKAIPLGRDDINNLGTLQPYTAEDAGTLSNKLGIKALGLPETTIGMPTPEQKKQIDEYSRTHAPLHPDAPTPNSQSQESVLTPPAMGPGGGAPDSQFADATNTPPAIQKQSDTVNHQSFIGSIISKGADFFRKVTS